MLQNALHFGAKRKLFWCKTRGILVINARQNAAKRKAKRIKIRIKAIDKSLSNH